MNVQATVRKHLRWVLVGAWLLLLAAGMFANDQLGHASVLKAGWTAVRDLPAQHQLRDVDLHARNGSDGSVAPRSDLLVGRHLISARREGQFIDTADVSLYPRIDRQSVSSLYLYPLTGPNAALTHVLEIGDSVRLCGGAGDSLGTPGNRNAAPPCGSTLTIATLHRATPAAPGDWLLLNLSTPVNADVVRSLDEGRRLLIVVPKSLQRGNKHP
jgi:hypothetical protein